MSVSGQKLTSSRSNGLSAYAVLSQREREAKDVAPKWAIPSLRGRITAYCQYVRESSGRVEAKR
jgi:hypothetical protein